MTDDEVVVYMGPERRRQPSVTQEQLDSLVERVAQRAAELASEIAAEKAAEKAASKAAELVKADFYKSVGKSVVDKALWVLGILVIAGYLYAKEKGLMK